MPRLQPESLRSRAFAAAAQYRSRYPSADRSTVTEALRLTLPALRHRPGLLAAASRPAPSPSSVAVAALARVRSWVLANDPPVVQVQRVLAVAVMHHRAAVEGEGAGVAYASVLVSGSRCSWWWGVSPSAAGQQLKRFIDAGVLRVVGMSGKTRRVAVGVGNPAVTEEAAVWLDPQHPVWSAVQAAYAGEDERRRWVSALHEDDTSFELDFDAEAMQAAEQRYRQRAAESRTVLLERAGKAASWERAKAAVKGMPKRGSSHSKLDSWMRRAAGRDAREEDRPKIVQLIQQRGHSVTVAEAVAGKIISAAGPLA